MSVPEHEDGLEQHIAQWRGYLRRRRAIRAVDIEELEDHLRAQFVSLVDAGLTVDEAFLVAVKRMGALDELSREFAQEYSERLWKQLVVPSGSGGEPGGAERTEAAVVVALAVVSALAVKAPELFGVALGDETAGFYARNMSLFVLPPLTGYFLWKRRLDRITLGWLALVFVAAALFANAFPFSRGGATEVLTALHLPIALWLVVGIAYAGGHWSTVASRMDFVRFSGELAIYYALIAFGGGVLTGFTLGMFQSIGQDRRVVGWGHGFCHAGPSGPSSSGPGSSRRSKALSRTWRRC